jgi:hypothetical protein
MIDTKIWCIRSVHVRLLYLQCFTAYTNEFAIWNTEKEVTDNKRYFLFLPHGELKWNKVRKLSCIVEAQNINLIQEHKECWLTQEKLILNE